MDVRLFGEAFVTLLVIMDPPGTVPFFLALTGGMQAAISEPLNRVLADSQILHALSKKHHWLMHGPTFAQLHALLDTHADQQAVVIDQLAEQIQALGGVAVGDPRHVAELTQAPRAPDGVEPVAAMLSRLEAHAIVIGEARKAARLIGERGDEVSYDPLVSQVLRTGETQGLGARRAPGRCLTGWTRGHR